MLLSKNETVEWIEIGEHERKFGRLKFESSYGKWKEQPTAVVLKKKNLYRWRTPRREVGFVLTKICLYRWRTPRRKVGDGGVVTGHCVNFR